MLEVAQFIPGRGVWLGIALVIGGAYSEGVFAGFWILDSS
jgi:hypothetical protein